MASVEQQAAEQATSGQAAEAPPEIRVENPATGEAIAAVSDMTAEQVAELARNARAVQPSWEALGFEGRGRVLLRAQKWLVDNAERVIETIVSETGKAWEDAQLAEVMYGANAFGFWAKNAPKYLADEKVKSSVVLVKGKKLILRYRPLGLVGVIGPWNYPLTNSFGDCIPALAAGNSVILKPSEITPLTSLLMAEIMEWGYDSDRGRDTAGAISAIMHGQAYLTSSRIAGSTGPCAGYEANAEPFLEVIRMHREAVNRIDAKHLPVEMFEGARICWDDALEMGRRAGYRNAQVTVIASNGAFSGQPL